MKAKKNKRKKKVVPLLVIASILTTGLATGATLLTTSPIQAMAATVSEGMTIKQIFPDPNLAKRIAHRLHISVDSIVTQTQLDSIDTLHARTSGISNIEGMEYLTNLKELDLSWNEISDLSPLANLTNLETIMMFINQISDLSPLANLSHLGNLYLDNNQISDLKPLANLTNLKELDLDNNQISDLKPLANLANLACLSLSDNQISDLSPLSNMSYLWLLRLFNNQISDLKPLANLTNLLYLNVSDNQISDPKPLANLTNLEGMGLANNQISDLKSLANLTNLKELDLDNNQISDLKPLANLTNLSELDLEYNQISDLSVLKDSAQRLRFCNVQHQTITLPDVNVGESTNFILNYYDGSVPAITYTSGTGTYSNNQLIWNMEGTGQLTWTAPSINEMTFSGTVNQKINEPEFANHIFWVTRPGDSIDLTDKSSVEVPVDYIDRIGRKEIDLMFYGEKDQLLDMNNYEISYSNNGVLGNTVTPAAWKTKGHANLPILGTGKTTMMLKDKTTGAVQKIVEVVVTGKGL